MTDWPPNTFGVAGLKNTGKTTLVERLVAELTGRGLRVATLKHAHHDFTTDVEGTDSHRHASAGAVETIVVSARKNVQIRQNQSTEPSLRSLLGRIGPHDVAIVEGWKNETLPKFTLATVTPEVIYQGTIAIVTASKPIPGQMPAFQRDDIVGIAEFLMEKLQTVPQHSLDAG